MPSRWIFVQEFVQARLIVPILFDSPLGAPAVEGGERVGPEELRADREEAEGGAAEVGEARHT